MGQTKLGETTPRVTKNRINDLKREYHGSRDNLDEVRHIEGFPVGEDEDIHRLSEPPYYTAYPNPHIKKFIERFGKPYDETTDNYHKEPFVGDISEGKNDPIYNVHSYHTKVPHQAIAKFIEHYTGPGDIIFDGFCGTGMTGIAAQLTERYSILMDLSPLATFLAKSYNLTSNYREINDRAQKALKRTFSELSWIYETQHVPNIGGKVKYRVWSDIYRCPYCEFEYVYWDLAAKEDQLLKAYKCPGCGAEIDAISSKKVLNDEGTQRQILVLVNYRIKRGRFSKKPTDLDVNIIRRAEQIEIPYWYPRYKYMFLGSRWGDSWRAGIHQGMTRVDQFYSKPTLLCLATAYHWFKDEKLLSIFISALPKLTKMNRFMRHHKSRALVGPMSGTLYVSQLFVENNVLDHLEYRLKKIKVLDFNHFPTIISTQSATDLRNIQSDSIDYIFTDPPFGDNIMYSELNFICEAWLKVFTAAPYDTVINKSQNKTESEYRKMMRRIFREFYRILKPNRWITVEFHNSRASVWNCIQESISQAGFIVAQVAVLDKQKGTIKQVNYPGTVKNDLVINAYKPRESFTKAFLEKAGYGLENEFLKQHLERLPIDQNIERTEQMLYSKMLAYYIQHGYEINMNAKEFYSMLREHFQEGDGYWFLDNQVDIYKEKKRRQDLKSIQATLFVSDERSAIQWLNWLLSEPKGYDEIYPEFVKVLTTTPDKIPELKELLRENFMSMDGKYRRPQALEKEEIEERRNQRLLREFENYLEKAVSGRKLESVRKEALLAGFILCYQQKRFQDILTVAKRIPKQIIESSTEIYDLIDVAETKIGDMK